MIKTYAPGQKMKEIDFVSLLKKGGNFGTGGITMLQVAEEIFRGRGVIPGWWALQIIYRDESKYFAKSTDVLKYEDLGNITEIHYLPEHLSCHTGKRVPGNSGTGVGLCPECKEDISPDWKYCPHCDTDLKPCCPECGKGIKTEWTVCPYCRSKIRTENGTLSPIELVSVEGGSFMMGSEVESSEKPVHKVTLDSFYIGKYPVTQKEFEEVMGYNPSYFKNIDNPVEEVSWYDAVMYCNKRSEKEGLSPYYKITEMEYDDVSISEARVFVLGGKGYRLPTEAEWEYSAKGGQKSRGYKYSGSNNPDEVGWHGDNSGGQTHPVGKKKPNELGIYDMSGNVDEWCRDWFDDSYYQRSPEKNPLGPGSGSYRVKRGGGWSSNAQGCRSANRGSSRPSNRFSIVGFRLTRTK
jgi:formylglycine-generating enzyme